MPLRAFLRNIRRQQAKGKCRSTPAARTLEAGGRDGSDRDRPVGRGRACRLDHLRHRGLCGRFGASLATAAGVRDGLTVQDVFEGVPRQRTSKPAAAIGNSEIRCVKCWARHAQPSSASKRHLHTCLFRQIRLGTRSRLAHLGRCLDHPVQEYLTPVADRPFRAGDIDCLIRVFFEM